MTSGCRPQRESRWTSCGSTRPSGSLQMESLGGVAVDRSGNCYVCHLARSAISEAITAQGDYDFSNRRVTLRHPRVKLRGHPPVTPRSSGRSSASQSADAPPRAAVSGRKPGQIPKSFFFSAANSSSVTSPFSRSLAIRSNSSAILEAPAAG